MLLHFAAGAKLAKAKVVDVFSSGVCLGKGVDGSIGGARALRRGLAASAAPLAAPARRGRRGLVGDARHGHAREEHRLQGRGPGPQGLQLLLLMSGRSGRNAKGALRREAAAELVDAHAGRRRRARPLPL